MPPRARRPPTGLLTSTGLVNWYSITFDPEGIFSGTPAMFVSSVGRSDPNKNIIFEIAPNGTLMGVFVQMTDGLSSLKFNINPTAILIPPVQDQAFLSGLIGGSGISSVNGTFAALYFQSSSYSPGQVISNSTLPTGVTQTELGEPVVAAVPDTATERSWRPAWPPGPIVGLTAANSDYTSTDLLDLHRFRHARRRSDPGNAGLQRHPGLRRRAVDRQAVSRRPTSTGSRLDRQPRSRGRHHAVPPVREHRLRPVRLLLAERGADSRRLDHHRRDRLDDVHSGQCANPLIAGSLFVSDLASGLYVTVTPLAPLPTTPILVPVQGSGPIGVTTDCRRATSSRSSPTATRPTAPTTRRPDHPRLAQRHGEHVRLWLRHQRRTGLHQLRQFDRSPSASRRTGRPSTPPTTTGSGSSRPPPTWPTRPAARWSA